MTALGASRVIDIDLGAAAAGLPLALVPSPERRMLLRNPDVLFWMTAGFGPASGNPLLRDQRSGARIFKRVADAAGALNTTTVVTPSRINGRPAVVFSGAANQGIFTPFSVPTKAYTLIALVKLYTTGNANVIGDGVSPSDDRLGFTLYSSGILRLDHGQSEMGKRITSSAPVITPNGAPAVIWGSFSQEANRMAIGVDSATPVNSKTVSTPHKGSAGMHIGTLAGKDYGQIDVTDTIILSRAAGGNDELANNELTDFINLLKTEYAIA